MLYAFVYVDFDWKSSISISETDLLAVLSYLFAYSLIITVKTAKRPQNLLTQLSLIQDAGCYYWSTGRIPEDPILL